MQASTHRNYVVDSAFSVYYLCSMKKDNVAYQLQNKRFAQHRNFADESSAPDGSKGKATCLREIRERINSDDSISRFSRDLRE